MLLLVKFISALVTKRRIAAEVTLQGCEPALVLPSKDFLGLTRLLEMLKVTKDERGPQYIMGSMNAEAGKDVHTLQLNVFPGFVLILTRDPENVKAMFVTHASSFEIGPWRGGQLQTVARLRFVYPTRRALGAL